MLLLHKSVACGKGKLTVAYPESRGDSATLIKLLGQVICGGVLSWIVTVKLQELLFPSWSLATQTTVLDPKPNSEPGGG
jgi:hypothetical protein